jgi:hypothetical protein
LEYFIPDSAKDINIRWANNDITIDNLITQMSKVLNSWVNMIQKKWRVVWYCNTSMSLVLNRIFRQSTNVIIETNNELNRFWINITRVQMWNYYLDLVEDLNLNNYYDYPILSIVDIEWIAMFNLAKWVIANDGKKVDAFWVSQIFVPAQTTYEKKKVSLNTHWSWLIKNVLSGAFRILKYV